MTAQPQLAIIFGRSFSYDAETRTMVDNPRATEAASARALFDTNALSVDEYPGYFGPLDPDTQALAHTVPIGGRPGGAGADSAFVSLVLQWTGPAVATGTAILLASFLKAAGDDAWKAVKEGVKRLRAHPADDLARAQVQLQQQIPPRWIRIWVPFEAVGEALDSLEDVLIQVRPGLVCDLDWNPQTKAWTFSWIGRDPDADE